MKKFLLVAFVSFLATSAFSQLFYNEWIDFSKTYYKFKVGATGVYRITNADLAGAGLANQPAQDFQLWRNGKQVAIYTSSATGPLGAGGFIEFWGEKNDGVTDRDLYRNPAHHLNDRVSLLTDTASYFLTVNPGGTNFRFTNTANNLTGNTLPAQPYFMHNVRHTFTQQIHRGEAIVAGCCEYVYSSSYDRGEMFSTFDITLARPEILTLDGLAAATNGPSASLAVSMAGSTLNVRDFRVELNNSLVITNQLASFAAGVFQNNVINPTLLSSNSATIKISNASSNQFDRIVCGFVDLTYPRQFNFGNQTEFAFTLPASATNQYLEISNFNSGSTAPVLYDLTNNRRYVVDNATPGTFKVLVQPSTVAAKLVLVSQNASRSVGVLQQRVFVNYQVAANQGDFIFITHPILRQPYNGVDQIEAYRQYRNSAPGGSFNSKIEDIDQLVDQFGYGIKKNPLAVKNFLRYARSKYAVAPKYALLVGKGVVYSEYRQNQSSQFADRLNIIPTFGYPASDILLASDNLDPIMKTAIGRLSAVQPKEVADYLEKLKQYDQAQQSPAQTIEQKAWMKNVVHVVGGNDENIERLLTGYMYSYEPVIRDTLFGANVFNFNKTTTGPVTPISSALMSSMFKQGISLLNYFGHSSATALDYNLDDPYSYENQGKYPMFLVNGCNAGNLYSYDTTRFTLLSTLSERFVLAKERGSIGFIASTHFGLTSYLDYYNQGFYRSLSKTGYGKSVSQNIYDASMGLLTSPYSPENMGARLHAEETTLHGDPAVKINSHPKPDFVVEEPQIKITPNIVSVSDINFSVKAYIYNVGKATGDSVTVQVKQQYPDGSTTVLLQKRIKSIRYMDSVMVNVVINPTRDKGQNNIIVTIDLDNQYDEMSESNNSNQKGFVIQDDDLRPVYPYNFSIVNRSTLKVAASTANPISGMREYRMEMDTTELFNSASKVTRSVTSLGGIIEFDPGITFRDSTVYYWRVATVPNSGPLSWVTSSFGYLAGTEVGYNQSHVYQHFKSTMSRMKLDSTTRQWKYGPAFTNMVISNAVYPINSYDNDFSISINGNTNILGACIGHSIIFNVFDPVTLKAYYNQAVPSVVPNGPFGNFMGSGNNCGADFRRQNFNFSYQDTVGRRKMRDFLDWVPNGAIVTARLVLDGYPTYANEPFADQYKADQNVYGVGNTLYDRFKAAGFADFDSFNRARTWVFIYKKGDNSFVPRSKMSQLLEAISLPVVIQSLDTLGTMTSPRFGPAKSWKQVKWRGSNLEATGDEVRVAVIGITNAGVEDTLFRMNPSQQDLDISGVNAQQYPNIRLHLITKDNLNLTPYQLRYWRVYYEPVPEGGLSGNLVNLGKDTLEVGEKTTFAIAFKNISDKQFSDSIRVRMILYDRNNVATVIPIARRKNLAPGDTTIISAEIDSRGREGVNTLFLDVNPDFDQPEQHRFNNILYKNIVVKADVFNPLMDVTFDGVRILNGDIVSAKPKILIKLKDESKFLALNDTSLATVFVQFPGRNGQLRRYAYNTDTLRFIPADISTGKNEAMIEFNPAFLQDSEGEFYELVVRAKDRVGNTAGNTEYRVKFQVINKPMISNVFNYPNPFTTSTAFVFTVTGSEVPQNLRIQIMTITGKIVKEITKQELGPINIGRNITEYKWDGTDQYGQKLANGVYLYRVITNLNGNTLEKYNPSDGVGGTINTDQYFNKGYGKMYLMR